MIIILITFFVALSSLIFLTNFETRGSSLDISRKNDFFSNAFSKNSIFILGSSQIAPLNATSINKILNKESIQNYEVYNLAYGGNSPYRENFDDELIEIHPLLVIYGISYRDFEFSEKNDFNSSIFPHLQDIIGYQLLKIGNNNIPLNPQFLVRSLLRDLSFSDLESTHNTHYVNNTPFFLYKKNPVLKTSDEITKNLSNSSRNFLADVSHPFNKHSERFLELFIEQMQNNSINIVLISTPLLGVEYLDVQTKNDYDEFLKKLETKYQIKVFRFDTIYNDLDIWQDASHISYHPSVSQFNLDVSKIIQDEVK